MESAASSAGTPKGLAYGLIEKVILDRKTSLDLSNCGLSEIPREVMELYWLEELIFSSGYYFDYDTRKSIASSNEGPANDIRIIPPGISKLTNLRTLVIVGSRTTDAEVDASAIGQLVNLKWLIIANTTLADIRPLGNLTQLEKLYIHDNQITSLVPLAKLEYLRVLRFSRNKVTDIKPLASLKNLRVLRFGKNQVADITPLLNHGKLENLSFYSNRVSSILPLSSLSRLNLLNFHSNSVTDISPLEKLSQLESLIVRGNHIVSLLPLSGLSKLKKLDLGKNDIISILPLYGLAGLIELSLKENQVSDVSPLADLIQLKELDCSNNPITNITTLGKLVGMERLYLKKTDIENAEALCTLGKLEELDLSNTKVNSLAPLEGAAYLQKLYLDNSAVALIRPLMGMRSLTKFSCLRCPITDCPADIYESGDPRQLQAYFEALATPAALATMPGEQGAGPMTNAPAGEQGAGPKMHTPAGAATAATATALTRRDVKLIILGNANTGKTNLVKYLEEGTFEGKRKTTHGLEVHRWIPDPMRFPALKDVTVSIWDFGGQEYYHDAYQLFLSSNAVYVLLWSHESDRNGRLLTLLEDGVPPKELEHFELKYWLDTIHHYTDGWENISLLAVQNKTDEPPGKRRIAQRLHDQFSIAESMHISLQDGAAGQAPQKAALNFFLSELEYLLARTADQANIPAYWQQIKNAVLSLSSGEGSPFDPYLKQGHDLFMTIEGFAEACEKIIGQPIAEKDQTTLPSWLNRGGVVIYFPNIPSLRDKIFVRPNLLVQRLYEVLNYSVLDKGGEFVAADVPLAPEMKDILLQIAMHLRLIFPHPVNGEGHYIAPQYLRVTHPLEDLYRIASNDAWQSALHFRMPLFYYKKALQGLLLYFAADKKTQGRYFWKHGILFLREGQGVLIKGLQGNGDEDSEEGGTILVGINRNATNRAGLQKEIFHRILVVLNIRQEEVRDEDEVPAKSQAGPGEEVLSPEALKRLGDIGLQVSYDEVNYADYVQLLRNPDETKIKAANSDVYLLTKNFASILPFTPPSAKKVFLSYSHRNTAWLARLRTHLAGLRRGKEIESWDDKELVPGDQWDDVIKKNIEEADVYILVLSADFVASEYIWRNELRMAIEGYRSRGAILIPILFEPFDVGGLPMVSGGDDSVSGMSIDDFEMIPKLDGTLRAVSLWENQEQALAVVAESIRRALRPG